MAANQKESKNLTTLQSYNPKIIVAVSGKGRLLECLFQAQTNFQFTIAGVIASNSHCGALEIAKRNQVPIFVGDYSEATLSETFKKQKIFVDQIAPGLIVLGGFLKRFPVDEGEGPRVINIHPALLPKFGGPGFYGMKVHEAVKLAGELYSGATVHLVNDHYDEGRILARAKLPLDALDTPEDIARKVFEIEKMLLPTAIQMMLKGTLNGQEIWEMV